MTPVRVPVSGSQLDRPLAAGAEQGSAVAEEPALRPVDDGYLEVPANAVQVPAAGSHPQITPFAFRTSQPRSHLRSGITRSRTGGITGAINETGGET